MPSKKSKPAVKIWFEGLPQPIPARAESLSDSQLLTVELPYLRRNTEVFISDAEGESRKGFMTEVSLVAGPEPKLQLLVQTGQPVFEPVSELPLMSDEGGGLESVELSEEPASLEPDLESDLDHRTSTVPLLTPLDDVAPAPRPRRAVEPGADAPPERRQEDRRQEDRRQVTTRLHSPPRELERPPSRRWWGLAAVALLLIGGAVMYYHGEARQPALGVAQAASRPVEEPTPVPAPIPVPVPLPPAPVEPAEQKPVEQKPVEQKPAAKKAPAEERPPVDRSAPRVWLGGKHPVLVVPIEGSTRGADSYALANPDGVAVNLPHARLNGLKTFYQFEAGAFKQLNVWGRKGGLYLRLFFHGKLPPHKLHFDKDAVRCTVYPR